MVVIPLLLVLSACPAGIARPDRVVTPDAVGIVETARVSEDGTTTNVDMGVSGSAVFDHELDVLVEGSSGLDPGNLALTGTLNEVRWFLALRRGTDTGVGLEDCHRIATPPFDDGDSVIFPAGVPEHRFGIRLPKADKFRAERPDPQTQRWGDLDGAFCLNEEGQVTGQAEELRRESE